MATTKKIKSSTKSVPNETATLPKDSVLVLRTCKKDLTSRNDFTWPASGPVEAPDWNPEPVCGQGLHGLLWGQGDGYLLDWIPEANWLLVEVPANTIIDLGGKVKFPKGNVIFRGTQLEATRMIHDRAPNGTVVVGLSLTREGPGQTVTVGYKGKANAGDRGTATAGDSGKANAGDYGTSTAGRYGTATAGRYGTSTAGDNGTANAGDSGKANAGDYGTSTAGRYGTSTAGRYGTASAGVAGEVHIKWWDYEKGRYRTAVGYVGEAFKGADGYEIMIEANVQYKCDTKGNIIKA